MTPLVTTIIIAIIAAAIGVVVTVVIHRSSAKNRARQIVADAERQALDIKKDKEIEGREEALKITAEAEKAANQRMSKIQSMEAKQKQRELQLNQQQGENARTRNELEAARQTLDEQYQAVERKEAIAGIFIYGNIHYKHKVRQPLELTTERHLDKDLKIVMISDLHLGYHNRRADFAKWVDIINAEKPDLILIGGDIVDINVQPLIRENVAEEFHRLEAPVYACFGNHEYYSGIPKALSFYNEAGINLLRDSVAAIGSLRVIGRDDRSNPKRKSLDDLMSGTTDSLYTILLDHQPYHLEEAEDHGIDFQFSGHTHRGQIWPASWITDRLFEDSWGEHQRGKTRYYVSSGIGIWGGKFRIGTRSEYVVATLRSVAAN